LLEKSGIPAKNCRFPLSKCDDITTAALAKADPAAKEIGYPEDASTL
jgi:hypothetical protein